MQIRKPQTGDRDELVRLLGEFNDSTQSELSKTQADFRAYADPEETSKQIATELLSPQFIAFVAADGDK